MAKKTLEVQGKREVVAAFNKVAKDADDMTQANKEVGGALLGMVQQGTRHATGTLAAAWTIAPDKTEVRFVNPLQWAIPQEFGVKQRGIEPTLAVRKAFEENTDAVERVYADAIRRSATDANIRSS